MTKIKGFTIVELIITLVIVSLLFGTGYMYMSGYLPRQSLNTSLSKVYALLMESQSNAQTKGRRYGVFFDTTRAVIFVDENRDHKPSKLSAGLYVDCSISEIFDRTCLETKGQNLVTFNDKVTLSTSGCTGNCITTSSMSTRVIVFNNKGYAFADDVNTVANREVKLYRSGVGTRQVEVHASGLIEKVKTGDEGNIP